MNILGDVITVLKSVLNLDSESNYFDQNTMLLGGIPEFDSQAVVSVVVTLEEYFDINIEDDEITAEVFETIGSLADFVSQKF